jgi:hypothetical protein
MVGGAAMGAMMGYLLPALIDYFRYRDARTILGEWHSSWAPENTHNKDWVEERVVISPRLGKLRLRNRQNSAGYEYEAEGKIVLRKHVVGVWRSIRPGATSAGIFSLTVSPQGDFMFGHFVGPNDSGHLSMGEFILGRTLKDVASAKQFINKQIYKDSADRND